MFNKKKKIFQSNKSREKKKKAWFFLAIFGFYLFKKVKKSDELKDIEHNFKDFLHKEKKEIKEYTKDKEDFKEFATDSSNLFKDYFIPHSGNNHMPKILRTRSLAIMLFLTVLLKFSVVAYLYFVFPNFSKADDIMVAKIFNLVNKARASESVAPLKLDPILSKSALEKAHDIINKNYFAHISPDGKKPWDFIDRGQYAYALVGENLAMNFTTANSVHEALMNSPSHKRNIMNDKYSDIGLAMVSGEIEGKKTNVLVQMFSTKVKRALVKDSEPKEEEKLVVAKTEKKEDVKVLSSVQEVTKKETTKKTEIKTKPVSQSVPLLKEEPKETSYKPASKQDLEKKAQEKLAQAKSNKVEPETKKTEIKEEEKNKTISSDNFLLEDTKAETLATKTIMIIKHPGDQVLAEAQKETLNYKMALAAKKEQSLPVARTTIEDSSDKYFLLSTDLIRASQIMLAAIVSLLIISLLVNIFVRFEIQHKPVLLQATAVLIFAIALLFINFHYLEGGLTTIYMS